MQRGDYTCQRFLQSFHHRIYIICIWIDRDVCASAAHTPCPGKSMRSCQSFVRCGLSPPCMCVCVHISRTCRAERTKMTREIPPFRLRTRKRLQRRIMLFKVQPLFVDFISVVLEWEKLFRNWRTAERKRPSVPSFNPNLYIELFTESWHPWSIIFHVENVRVLEL